jgi:hypothetical protein
MFPARALLGIGCFCILIAGCATHGASANATTGGETPKAAAELTIDSSISEICDDPRGRAVMDRDLPNLRKNPNYFLFAGFSLRDLVSMSGGRISQEKLELVQRDLAALSAAHPDPVPVH